MIKKIRTKIESKRGSKNIIWKLLVSAKDFLWIIQYYLLYLKEVCRIFFVRRKLFRGISYDYNLVLPPLVSRDKFARIFSDFKGKNLGFVRIPGNIGDNLIEDSTKQLLKEFNVRLKKINKKPRLEILNKRLCSRVDEFVLSGGGYMGDGFPSAARIVKSVLEYGKPVTILPQTFSISRDNTPYKRIWVREKESLKFREDALLVPDLALGYEYKGKLPKVKYKSGIWLRGNDFDTESLGIEIPGSLGDPVLICSNTRQYIQLAALYETIITDRLHFAIAGLIARRKVILLTTNYFKNRAVYEAWLKDLGCEWGEFNSISSTSSINYGS